MINNPIIEVISQKLLIFIIFWWENKFSFHQNRFITPLVKCAVLMIILKSGFPQTILIINIRKAINLSNSPRGNYLYKIQKSNLDSSRLVWERSEVV